MSVTEVEGGGAYGEGGASYDPSDDVDEGTGVVFSRAGLTEGGTPDAVLKRGAGVVGWFLLPDGRYERLPADPQSRERYDLRGFQFLRAWGTFIETDVVRNGVVVSRPEGKYEQLERLVNEGVAPVEALTEKYRRRDDAGVTRGIWREGCSCGFEAITAFHFRAHRMECEQPTNAELREAREARAAGWVCEQCAGQTFKSEQGYKSHMGRMHGSVGS